MLTHEGATTYTPDGRAALRDELMTYLTSIMRDARRDLSAAVRAAEMLSRIYRVYDDADALDMEPIHTEERFESFLS